MPESHIAEASRTWSLTPGTLRPNVQKREVPCFPFACKRGRTHLAPTQCIPRTLHLIIMHDASEAVRDAVSEASEVHFQAAFLRNH